MNARRLRISVFLAGLAVWPAAATVARADSSDLWGGDGARWTANSRLPDFSRAGYRGGAQLIPRLPVSANVRDYGAKGDGKTDDTAAFRAALSSVEEGAVLVPAGKYRITGALKIDKSRVALRGEGIDRTVLFFPKPLASTAGPAKKHAPGGSWSWSGGLISFEGGYKTLRLATVTGTARRGETALALSAVAAVMPGQQVRLVMSNAGGALARYLYGDAAVSVREDSDRKLVDFISPVVSVEGNRIVLARPVRTDVRPEWKPEIWALGASVQDVGIEDLTIEFPRVTYVGHHIEPGFNAISFEGIINGWVRNVRIVNADNGVFLRGRSRFCTVESVLFSATGRRLRTGYGSDRGEPQTMPVGGHHGILIADAYDNLVTGCEFEFRFIHDLGVSAWATGNVCSNVRGIDLSFDHHRRGPYENLFTDIDAGEGSRLWQSGGDEEDGPHSGVRETFWNIRAATPQKIPAWSLQGNFVGVSSTQPSRCSADGDWWEAIPPEKLQPSNIYLDQKRRAAARAISEK